MPAENIPPQRDKLAAQIRDLNAQIAAAEGPDVQEARQMLAQLRQTGPRR